jgi:hypothetical protein
MTGPNWPELRAQAIRTNGVRLAHLPFRARSRLAVLAGREGLTLRVSGHWTAYLVAYVRPDPPVNPQTEASLLRPREIIRASKRR